MRLEDEAALDKLLKANPALKVHGVAPCGVARLPTEEEKAARAIVEGRAAPVRPDPVVVLDPEYQEKPAKKKRGPSELELLFGRQISDLHPEKEWRFHPERRWRFDYAWPGQKVAVEVDGGSWCQGRHTRGLGYERDCEKMNTAVLLGWRILRFTGSMVKSGEAERITREALQK